MACPAWSLDGPEQTGPAVAGSEGYSSRESLSHDVVKGHPCGWKVENVAEFPQLRRLSEGSESPAVDRCYSSSCFLP
jgi:hypothetical protein